MSLLLLQVQQLYLRIFVKIKYNFMTTCNLLHVFNPERCVKVEHLG